MPITAAFASAPNPVFYESALPLTAAEAEKISLLNQLAALIPANPVENIVASSVYHLTGRMEETGNGAALGMGFNAAFADLMTSVKKITYLDGNKNICAKGDMHGRLLDAFTAFHQAQKTVRLTDAGNARFDHLTHTRKIYWGMQHGGLSPTSYEPSY